MNFLKRSLILTLSVLIPLTASASYVVRNGSITASKLASDSVTTVKILDSNVTTIKIADLNVTTGKINDLAVTAGKLAANAVETAKILDQNVTIAKMAPMPVTSPAPSGTPAPAGGIALSSSSGNFSGTATSYADVTNLTVSITSTGRPIRVVVVPDGSSNSFIVGFVRSNQSGTAAYKIIRNSSDVAFFEVQTQALGATQVSNLGPFALEYTDFVSAGTYVYKVQYQSTSSGPAATVYVQYARLMAYEI